MITITEVAAFKCTLVVKEIRLLQLLCLKIHWIVSLAVDVKANFWRRKSQSAEKKLKPLKIEFLGGMKRMRNNNLKITQLREVANWCTDMQIHLPAANYDVL